MDNATFLGSELDHARTSTVQREHPVAHVPVAEIESYILHEASLRMINASQQSENLVLPVKHFLAGSAQEIAKQWNRRTNLFQDAAAIRVDTAQTILDYGCEHAMKAGLCLEARQVFAVKGLIPELLLLASLQLERAFFDGAFRTFGYVAQLQEPSKQFSLFSLEARPTL